MSQTRTQFGSSAVLDHPVLDHTMLDHTVLPHAVWQRAVWRAALLSGAAWATLLTGCGESATAPAATSDLAVQADGDTGTDASQASDATDDGLADSEAQSDVAAAASDAAEQPDAFGATDAVAATDAQTGDTDSSQSTDVSAATDASPGTDASAGTDAASDATLDAGPDAATVDPSQVQCTAASPLFPAYSTSCASNTDCAVALHQIDCCGSHVAVGVASSDLAKFSAAEAICEAQYPDCKCAAKMPLGQDGVYLAEASDFAAVCSDGVCLAKAKSGPDCKSALGWAPWKWCQKTSDCSYTLHTTDCCGSQAAVGVAKVAKSAYESTEYKCAPEPVCDCLPKPVTAEDGGSAGDGLIAVTCEAGLCQTYIKN